MRGDRRWAEVIRDPWGKRGGLYPEDRFRTVQTVWGEDERLQRRQKEKTRKSRKAVTRPKPGNPAGKRKPGGWSWGR